MSYPPRIIFIDRSGKATVTTSPPTPRDGQPGFAIADRAGRPVALKTSVPRSSDPLTAIARGIAVSTGGWIPAFEVDGDCWMDNWSCNEYSEDFNSPPLAQPPWSNVLGTYSGGKVSVGSARMKVYPSWPMTFGEYFYWDSGIEGLPYLPSGDLDFQIFPPSGSTILASVLVSIPAWDPPPPVEDRTFDFYFSTYHPDVGTVSSDLYHFEADPWVLDGQKFTAKIYEEGSICVSFYGENWCNGGGS